MPGAVPHWTTWSVVCLSVVHIAVISDGSPVSERCTCSGTLLALQQSNEQSPATPQMLLGDQANDAISFRAAA